MTSKINDILLKFAVAVAALFLAICVANVGLVRQLVAAGQGKEAAAINPGDPLALASHANELLGFDVEKGQLNTNREALNQAERYARLALADDPLNAPALRVLSYIALARNDHQAANNYGNAAWRRDKRDSFSTLAILTTSVRQPGLVEGDPVMAADAIESLFRRRPEQVVNLMTAFLPLIDQDVALREELFARMRTDPPWVGRFVELIGDKGSLSLIGEALSRNAGLPEATSRSLRVRFGGRLLDEGRLPEAAQVLRPLTPRSLEKVAATITSKRGSDMLAWWPLAAEGGTVTFTDPPSSFPDMDALGGSAFVSYIGSGPAKDFLGRGFLLPPGQYQLDYAAMAAAPGFTLRIVCWYTTQLAYQPVAPSPTQEAQRATLEFTVPDAGCPVSRVVVAVESRSALRQIDLQIWFGAIRLLSGTSGETTPATLSQRAPE